MEKKRIITSVIALVVLFALLLTGCKNKKCEHTDNNGDRICDSCKTDLTSDSHDSNLPESDPETGCVHSWLPATCESDGFCIRCGAEGNKAKGHTPGELVVNLRALCEVEGQYIRPCTECDEVLEVLPIPALSHNWVDGVCTNCGDTQP